VVILFLADLGKFVFSAVYTGRWLTFDSQLCALIVPNCIQRFRV